MDINLHHLYAFGWVFVTAQGDFNSLSFSLNCVNMIFCLNSA